ncbi:hypothetical protein ACJJTC_012250 [Scirpophaga incertulas]
MGKHAEWRKLVKKERRRRLRTQKAKLRDDFINKSSVEYKEWQKEQKILEEMEYQQIEKANEEEHNKWVKAEAIAIQQWAILQEQKKKLFQEYVEQEAKLKMEWEMEQKRKEEEQEKLKRMEEQEKERHTMFMCKLKDFLSGDSIDPPPELQINRETRPHMEICPFFSKTACCRFGDLCSRNHIYPGVSKVLLATNFFQHFGLNNANYNEYDTDVMLEYEDSDTYKQFVEFFNDVLPEFQKFGRITLFKVCNNYEKHLRGNTYIEYAELRCAVAAYQSLHSRWYGGRQLSLQFCLVGSWNNALCGLAPRRRCPKGRACNFLHVFKNPNHKFSYNRTYSRRNSTDLNSSSRTWRWSESPEKEVESLKELSRNRERHRHKSKSTNRKSKTHKRRSKSPIRHGSKRTNLKMK